MEVKITNKINKVISVNIPNDEEKINLTQEEEHIFIREELKEFEIQIIDESENITDNFKITTSCNLIIESDGIYNLLNDKRTKLDKIIKEHLEIKENDENNAKKQNEKEEIISKKIGTIYKDKIFNFNFEQFIKDELYYINNDISTILKFKEIKYIPEKKIEIIMIDNNISEERIFDPLKDKITNLIKIKLIIIHSGDIIFEKFIVININDKIENIYKSIEEKAKYLNIGKDFRIVLKDTDISGKALNKKFFRNSSENNDDESNESSISDDENGSESCSRSITQSSHEQCEEDDDCNEYENEDNSENNEENEHSNESNSKEEEWETIEDQEDISERKEINSESQYSQNVDSSSSKSIGKDKKKNTLKQKKINGNTSNQTLVDMNFDFKKDYLCILPPEKNFKIFSLKDVTEDSFCHDYESRRECENIFIFSQNIIIKNFYISCFNYGNVCSRNTPEFDFTLYEIDINPKDKEIKLEKTDEESPDSKYEDLKSVWSKKKNGKVIFEKRKIRNENCPEDPEFKKAIDNGFNITTNEIKISKNKVYVFLFKFGSNESYYDYSKFYYYNQRFKIKDDDDLIMYGYSPHDYYFLFGFNYKLNLFRY